MATSCGRSHVDRATYYFNFVQVPAMAEAGADSDGPGPAAIGKYVAPRALFWFRWAALATWLSGAYYLWAAPYYSLHGAFTLGIGLNNVQLTSIGLGAWLGTIMLLNVWGIIWPNQKKVLGLNLLLMKKRQQQRGWPF